MPQLNLNGVAINYELDGQGQETLVILNGIMMSTASWNDHVPVYLKNGYQVLRVDFRDQGLSSKTTEPYSIEQHAEDLEQLFAALNLDQVHLHGISYGGQVALLYALKYPGRLKSLILANTVSRITNYLKGIGEAWIEAAKMYDGEKFFRLVMPLVYSDVFYQDNWDWLQQRQAAFGKILTKEWFDAYIRLANSNTDFDITDQLEQIQVPTLVIATDRDPVTPLEDSRAIKNRIANARLVIIPDSGHASCYEKRDEYNLLLLGFMALLKDK